MRAIDFTCLHKHIVKFQHCFHNILLHGLCWRWRKWTLWSCVWILTISREENVQLMEILTNKCYMGVGQILSAQRLKLKCTIYAFECSEKDSHCCRSSRGECFFSEWGNGFNHKWTHQLSSLLYSKYIPWDLALSVQYIYAVHTQCRNTFP